MKLQLALIFMVFIFSQQVCSHTLYDIIECSKSKRCDGESQCQIDLQEKCSTDDDSKILENQDCKTVKQYESSQKKSIDAIVSKSGYQTPDEMTAFYTQYQIKDEKLAQSLQNFLSEYKNYYDQYYADKSDKNLEQTLYFRQSSILYKFKELLSFKIIDNNLYKAYQSCTKTCHSLLTNQEAKTYLQQQLQCYREINEESSNIASNIGILQFSFVLIQIIVLLFI